MKSNMNSTQPGLYTGIIRYYYNHNTGEYTRVKRVKPFHAKNIEQAMQICMKVLTTLPTQLTELSSVEVSYNITK